LFSALIVYQKTEPGDTVILSNCNKLNELIVNLYSLEFLVANLKIYVGSKSRFSEISVPK